MLCVLGTTAHVHGNWTWSLDGVQAMKVPIKTMHPVSGFYSNVGDCLSRCIESVADRISAIIHTSEHLTRL